MATQDVDYVAIGVGGEPGQIARVVVAELARIHRYFFDTARRPKTPTSLGLDWLLPVQLRNHPELFRPIDLAGLGAAAALGAVALWRARRLWPIRHNRPETLLLVTTPACLIGLHLLYVQFDDTYLVPFVPFAPLLLAVQFRESIPAPRLAAPSLAVSLATLMLLSLWIRADFAAQTTQWAVADRLTKAGVPAAEIYGEPHWMEYHGAFDDWLAAGKPGHEFALPRSHAGSKLGVDPFHDPFDAWLPIRGHHAAYHVVQDYPMPESAWRLIACDSYRDFAFRRREVCAYEEVKATQAFK